MRTDFSARRGPVCLCVDGFFGLNPGDLVGHEVFGQAGMESSLEGEGAWMAELILVKWG